MSLFLLVVLFLDVLALIFGVGVLIGNGELLEVAVSAGFFITSLHESLVHSALAEHVVRVFRKLVAHSKLIVGHESCDFRIWIIVELEKSVHLYKVLDVLLATFPTVFMSQRIRLRLHILQNLTQVLR